MQKIVDYLRAVRQEMLKVTWPAKDEVVSTTTLVVVFSIVVSLVVWGFDQIANFLVYNQITGS